MEELKADGGAIQTFFNSRVEASKPVLQYKTNKAMEGMRRSGKKTEAHSIKANGDEGTGNSSTCCRLTLVFVRVDLISGEDAAQTGYLMRWGICNHCQSC